MTNRRVEKNVHICVMGVSGVGKSTVGRDLADRLHRAFVDADDLHSAANVAKMASGVALTDADRTPWLDAVVARLDGESSGIVFACSALTRGYRARIGRAELPVFFVHLTADADELRRRMTRRAGHFMKAQMLDSQLATLQPMGGDENGVEIQTRSSVSETVDSVIEIVCPEGDLNPHAR